MPSAIKALKYVLRGAVSVKQTVADGPIQVYMSFFRYLLEPTLHDIPINFVRSLVVVLPIAVGVGFTFRQNCLLMKSSNDGSCAIMYLALNLTSVVWRFTKCDK